MEIDFTNISPVCQFAPMSKVEEAEFFEEQEACYRQFIHERQDLEAKLAAGAISFEHFRASMDDYK